MAKKRKGNSTRVGPGKDIIPGHEADNMFPATGYVTDNRGNVVHRSTLDAIKERELSQENKK